MIPVIQCFHIEQTLEFYQQNLRYIIIKKTQNEEGLQWVYLKSDNTYLMLQKNANSTLNQGSSGNIVLHYYTSDVAAQHQFMTAKGIKVGEIELTPYHMSQFFISDPESNNIVIGQTNK